jgi:nucleotide-binding universal stress UspA family protein
MSTGSEEQKKIVVGYDGSDGSRRALDWALGEAALRGAPLSVVRAWTPGEFGGDKEMVSFEQGELEKELTEVVTRVDVPWQAVVEQGSAAKILLNHAADAQMLVVGSRGRGGFAGLVLGSVGIQVSTHAGATVVVIVKEQA